ncbi:MAG TPA: DUF6152 family protein [Bryobacteraceae bacterium]|nr:DUF6152 family protein [Bryobacteraceae bacterium]
MKSKVFGVLAVGIGLLLSGMPAAAHHSFAAEYDSSQVLTLKGTISKVEWTNPHIYIYLDVKDADGKVTTWALEGYPPNTLKRTGFSKDSLKIGDEVTITAYKSKDGTNTGAGREITFPDGTKKFAGPVGAN